MDGWLVQTGREAMRGGVARRRGPLRLRSLKFGARAVDATCMGYGAIRYGCRAGRMWYCVVCVGRYLMEVKI